MKHVQHIVYALGAHGVCGAHALGARGVCGAHAAHAAHARQYIVT
jgi:hypothetical protein